MIRAPQHFGRGARISGIRAREREDLIPLVPRYNTFVLLLGMVRPMQVDGVWDRDGLVYNAYLARLLTRGQYYDLHKHCRPDVVDLIEAVSAHWAAAWTMGGAATGDETLVPHTGLRAGPLKMYIVRKPHNTGIKLTTTGTEDAEGSEPPLSQETQEGDAGEDDPEADGEDEEEADSDEEEEEEEAEDARGSVENDTLEIFSFSVQ